MPLPLRDLVDLIVEYHRRYMLPLPVPKDVVYKWAYKLNIRRGGETVLYTGALYQLLPYIKAVVSNLVKLEKTPVLPALFKVARGLGLQEVMSSVLLRVSEEELRGYYEILEKIAILLRKAGVDYGYLYEDDYYPGTLLYLLGLEEELKVYARNVYSRLKSLGVKVVITVDPHTTHLMRFVYRELIPEYDLHVKSYIEVLAESNLTPYKRVSTTVTIHDPCYYARYLNLADEPRMLLERGGIVVKDITRSRDRTVCCGGPLEFIAPRLAESIAAMRLEELRSASENIVTLCPICYLRFTLSGKEPSVIQDISYYLYAIYGGGDGRV
jgi:Fe-S oxidoreductase